MKINVKVAVAALAIAGAASLSGCHKAEPTHTVDWFQAHTAALAKTLAECKQNPGDLGNTPNCKNAHRAHSLNLAHAAPAPLPPVK